MCKGKSMASSSTFLTTSPLHSRFTRSEAAVPFTARNPPLRQSELSETRHPPSACRSSGAIVTDSAASDCRAVPTARSRLLQNSRRSSVPESDRVRQARTACYSHRSPSLQRKACASPLFERRFHTREDDDFTPVSVGRIGGKEDECSDDQFTLAERRVSRREWDCRFGTRETRMQR